MFKSLMFKWLIQVECGYATFEFINNSANADTFLWDVDGTGYIETFEQRGSNIGIDKNRIVTLITKHNEHPVMVTACFGKRLETIPIIGFLTMYISDFSFNFNLLHIPAIDYRFMRFI